MDPKKTQIRINLLEFFYFAGTAGASYLSASLQTAGLDSVGVGTVMSINSAIGFFSPTIFGLIADRGGSARKSFFFTLITTSLIWLSIPVAMPVKIGTFPLMVIFVLLGSFFRMPTGGLLDSWILQIQEAEPRVVYAHARKYGSLGYAVMSLCTTFITGIFGIGAAFCMLACLLPVILPLANKVGDPPKKSQHDPVTTGIVQTQGESSNRLQVGRIFHQYYLITHLLCLVVCWMPFSLSYTTIPYLLGDMGHETAMLGTVYGMRAFLEVPALALVPLVLKRFKPYHILPAAFFYYALEQFAFSFTTSFSFLIGIVMVSGAVYGVALGTNINYVHSLAPPGLKATVVAMNAAASSLANIIGNLMVGVLIKTVGIRACYMVIGSMVVVSSSLMLFFLYMGKKQGIPR